MTGISDVQQLPYRAIVIGGSAGSFQPVTRLLSCIPRNFPIPIFLCLHRLKHVRHGFVEALSIRSLKKISEPTDKEQIRQNRVYLAPANYHMGISDDSSIFLSTEGLINNSRPSIDILFESAAYAYGPKLLGILLSGANRDGAEGMRIIKCLSGTTIVQDPEESMINAMPAAALAATEIDHILSVENIISFLINLHSQTIP
ncbi:MAG: chemotaxis protein CheB [Bernardetiaceae bacterium]